MKVLDTSLVGRNLSPQVGKILVEIARGVLVVEEQLLHLGGGGLGEGGAGEGGERRERREEGGREVGRICGVRCGGWPRREICSKEEWTSSKRTG